MTEPLLPAEDVHRFSIGHLDYEISLFNLNEPPPEFIHVTTPSNGWSLGKLEDLSGDLARDLGWTTGFYEAYSQKSGGIGADGITQLAVSLQVAQTLPAIDWLLEKLGRTNPGIDSRESALRRAESAILARYNHESRSSLTLTRESEKATHWGFAFRSSTGDTYSVDVHGVQGRTCAEYVTWQSRDYA